MLLIISLSFALFLLFPTVPAQQTTCQSFGVDIIDGGTYCINTLLSEDFAFGSLFQSKLKMEVPRTLTELSQDVQRPTVPGISRLSS